MEFVVGNDIEIVEPTFEAKNWCKENLIIDNPDYVKKVRMNKWIGNTPKKISLYESLGSRIRVPFGCLKDLYSEFGHRYAFKAIFKPVKNTFYDSGITPYPYQEKAIKEALNAKNGVIVMPCGSGKTQTALEIVSRVGGRCLWLTHTLDLLNQSMSRAKSCFGLAECDYGTITGGKVKLGKITFATVQTMCNLDLNKYRDEFDIVIVDECHKCIGSPTRVMQFYKVLTNICCRYKFGLTATPKRADGLEKSMFAILGKKIVEISKDAVAEMTCPIKVEVMKTGYVPNLDIVLAGDGTINYSSLVDDLVHDGKRFDFVKNVINGLGCGGKLVLANRVEYLEKLNESFEGRSICLSGIGTSKKAKAERKEALAKLNSGELDCIFATYQLAKEGLDVPNLKYVVFATPEKDETTVTQSAGRVGRKAEGKEFGTVIDFEDDFGMYKGWLKKRMSVYRKLKFILT